MTDADKWSMITPGWWGYGDMGVCYERAGNAGFTKSGWYVYFTDDPVGPFKTLRAAKEYVEQNLNQGG